MKRRNFVFVFFAIANAATLDKQTANNEQGVQTLLFTPESQLLTADDDQTSCKNVCGDGFCCCHHDSAVCSGKSLTYIPRFQTHLWTLDFSDNNLNCITETTFQNVTFLSSLNLEGNNITRVHPQAFLNMTKLERLSLERNGLKDFGTLATSLKHAVLLADLNVANNTLRSVDFSVLGELSSLKNLSLSDNYIGKIEVGPVAGDIKLESLDLGYNMNLDFPDFCKENGTLQNGSAESVLPHLKSLNIEWNKIGEMDPHSKRCYPSLTSLTMDGNSIYHIQQNFLQGFPKLRSLSLRFCMARLIDSFAFNHSGIEQLDVSENLWFFDKVHGRGIDPGLFQDLTKLKFINMSWTVFRYSEADKREQILSSLKQVEAFVLEGTGLSFIPSTILSSFRNLIYLGFSKNEIAWLPDNAFENMTSLRVLDLSKNHLTTFRQELLESVVSRVNATLDLSGNPFSCTCDLLWFLQLYQKDASKKKGRLFTGEYRYVCSSPDKQKNADLASVDVTDRTCAFSYETYLAILFVSMFSVIFLIVASLVYRFRWRLRFLMYTVQHRMTRERPTGPAPPPQYDAFVSYDKDDNDWVLHVLRPELEDRRGLRLCLHERDFTPGRYISDNIIEKMQESGAILPVLSNAFLKSEWCRFELFVAVKSGLTHAQRRVLLVPLLLENLDRSSVDGFISALLHTTTYLAWPKSGSEEERYRFWRSLCAVLAKSIGRELRQFPSERNS